MCQPGRPGPQGESQLALCGLVALRALPEREVARIPLRPRRGVLGGIHVVGALPGQLAVGGPRAHVEVDVAARVLGRVGVAALDEPGDDRVHAIDAGRRPGLVGRRQDAQRAVRGRELELDPVRQRVPRLVVARALQDLVVDVGDVADEGHGVAAVGQPAPPQVVDERAAEVPDVRRGLHRRAADVHADAAGNPRSEVDDGLPEAVVQADAHPPSLPAAVRPTGGPSRRP